MSFIEFSRECSSKMDRLNKEISEEAVRIGLAPGVVVRRNKDLFKITEVRMESIVDSTGVYFSLYVYGNRKLNNGFSDRTTFVGLAHELVLEDSNDDH